MSREFLATDVTTNNKVTIHLYNIHSLEDKAAKIIHNLQRLKVILDAAKDVNVLKILKVGNDGIYISKCQGSKNQTESGLSYYIQEYKGPHTLHDLFSTHSSKDSWIPGVIASHSFQLYQVLLLLQQNEITHCDLRPKSLFVDATTYRLYVGNWDFVSFNLDKEPNKETKKKPIKWELPSHDTGLPKTFFPKEFLDQNECSARVDEFSLGMIMFLMMYTCIPFLHAADVSYYHFNLSDDEGGFKELNPIVKKLLSEKPSERHESIEDTLKTLYKLKEGTLQDHIVNAYVTHKPADSKPNIK